MVTWKQAYMMRADAMDRMSIYDPSYNATWNELEDDVLSLERSMQHELVNFAIGDGTLTGGAMVILSILQFEELTCGNA
jgi:hypothetical protein